MEFGVLEGTTRFRENYILEEVQDVNFGENPSWGDFAGLLHRQKKSKKRIWSSIEYDTSTDLCI